MTSTTDEFPSEDLEQGTEPTKASWRPQQRGRHMTACKLAAQFPDDMESRNNGSEMWCIHCHVPVNYREKSYVWFPTTAALVERSFSLTGLIDAKNRQKMSPAFRATAVAMFCNGDVEERFSKE